MRTMRGVKWAVFVPAAILAVACGRNSTPAVDDAHGRIQPDPPFDLVPGVAGDVLDHGVEGDQRAQGAVAEPVPG